MFFIRVKTELLSLYFFPHAYHLCFHLSFSTFPLTWLTGSLAALCSHWQWHRPRHNRLINQWQQGQQYHTFLPLPPETRRSKVSLATLEQMHFILAASTWHDHIAAEGGKNKVLKGSLCSLSMCLTHY